MVKEPGEMSFGESEKSPEQIKYEELMDQAIHLPMEGSDEFASDEDPGREPNLRDDFYLSGDPEKIAIFKMLETKNQLDRIAATMRIEKGKKSNKELERQREILGTSLLDVGLDVPESHEEAKRMREGLCTFENWQKIKSAVIDRQREE